MTRRRMLCSGTGGPRKAGLRVLTCPVCGKADFSRYPATQRVVPRHFVKRGAAAPAAPRAAVAQSATNPDTHRAAVSR
jgi:hypothetical protein